ncbi:MAG: RNA methyltransferase [Alphaproteobacteria bacterium]|nr:RNA methyltransferase [Alphaproteobacteria bacterium]
MQNETKSDSPALILVRPQMGENIGASARAMANFNLMDLSLVAPRDGWPSESAKANAVGALDLINPVEVFNTTKDALKSYTTVYATTARPRDMRKKTFDMRATVKDITTRHQNGEKCAILFGGERAGLSNDDVSLAHHIITIPTNPDFSSINLGQSVLLFAYEWFQATHEGAPPTLPQNSAPPASHEIWDELMQRLESELKTHNFFRTPDMQPTMMRNIRNLFSRAQMSEQETKTMHGIISALIGKKINSQ